MDPMGKDIGGFPFVDEHPEYILGGSDMGYINGKLLNKKVTGYQIEIWIFWLVVWNFNFIFPYIGLLIIPIDFHIFQRGSNHQPDFSLSNNQKSKINNYHWYIPLMGIYHKTLVFSSAFPASTAYRRPWGGNNGQQWISGFHSDRRLAGGGSSRGV